MSIRRGNKIIASRISNGFSLFDCKWADHVLNNISWLRADTFSWHSGDVYVAAYNRLVDGIMRPTMYAWSSSTYTFYTLTDVPAIGDDVYFVNKNYGTTKVLSVSNNTITFEHHRTGETTTATRNHSSDTNALAYGLNKSTETIGGVTITYYRSEDGRKICLPDQESNLLTLYNSTGVAWYYILDTENKRFKLPRTKYGFTGLRDSVGGYVSAGLPNITAGLNNTTWTGTAIAEGAFSSIGVSPSGITPTTGNGGGGWQIGFDASRSSSIYGNSDTVQPPATQMYLYFYVGNFEQSAIEQTAGLNAELFNDKADRDLKNLPSNYDYVVATQEPTSANGYTWFRKYKSGWVEQGGRAVIYNGNAEPNRYDAKDISIPVPMKHCTNWHCQAKHDRFNAGIGQDNITTTAHIYQVNDSENTFVNAFVIWEISGYAA